jgi:hypothetical protein
VVWRHSWDEIRGFGHAPIAPTLRYGVSATLGIAGAVEIWHSLTLGPGGNPAPLQSFERIGMQGRIDAETEECQVLTD